MYLKMLVVFLALIVAGASTAQNELRTKHFNIEKSGLAIQGYDPVSYFLDTPKKGNAEFSFNYNGVVYRFVNQRNLDLFKAGPAKYEPAYGGWCAYAMGLNGEKVEVDPETYKIVNGKLLLFYHTFLTNTLPKWNADEKNLTKNADGNWVKIYK